MKLLEDMVNSLPNDSFHEKVVKICDRIQKEEEITSKEESPGGALILLVVEVNNSDPPTFVCLENEFPQVYIISIWKNNRRIRTYELNNLEIKKMFEKFASIVSFYRTNRRK